MQQNGQVDGLIQIIGLKGVRDARSNLELRSGAQVLRVLIDHEATAYGVEYLKDLTRVKVPYRHWPLTLSLSLSAPQPTHTPHTSHYSCPRRCGPTVR